ncbi:glycosyltransferase [Flavihumibacter fluvii]|uniref:glycosyltransferase n=1 Tax=Flavihumibacter fluvii TaxID=2838157 RepID=UPI001BDF2981|nr:glycosyltransferase [Flavihumibacter fluvii]ULQ52399.1 hypothetical protein KJS93_20130 [Flavihumibacter fluvii]
MKILFITTSNLATNPRLLKEVRLAIDKGFTVTVICFSFNNWSKQINDELISELSGKADIHTISMRSASSFSWINASIIERTGRIFGKLHSSPRLAAISNKRSLLLLQALNYFHKHTFDFVVAHNPGALYPAWRFARKKGIPYCFDIEDYHPGETASGAEADKIRSVMRYYLRDAAYLSAASPLILQHTLEDIGDFTHPAIVVHNFFPTGEFIPPKPDYNNPKLKIIWFSQNINHGRGLEEIAAILPQFDDRVELHLIGNLNADYYEKYLKGIGSIKILSPVAQKQLHHELASYDVGLAIEPSKDLNNELAVSNKLNAYIQGGVYVLASDTKGQRQHMMDHQVSGELVNLKSKPALTAFFNQAIQQKDQLRQSMADRFEKQKKYSWETEAEKLLQVWTRIVL